MANTPINFNIPKEKNPDATPRPFTVDIPCSIGDKMWGIRNVRGTYVAMQGVVSEMFFFSTEMELQIVLKYVSRGRYGDTIFATQKACQAKVDYLNTERNPYI